jgi:hypothetical protein
MNKDGSPFSRGPFRSAFTCLLHPRSRSMKPSEDSVFERHPKTILAAVWLGHAVWGELVGEQLRQKLLARATPAARAP